MCRGYPLSIDPNDPNIEIMPLAAINNPYQGVTNGGVNGSNNNGMTAPLAAVDELTASTLLNSSSNGMKSHQNQQPSQSQAVGTPVPADASSSCALAANLSTGSNDEYYCEEYEELYASIVKGPKGFGFTIADDSQMNHQKVLLSFLHKLKN